MRHLYLTLIECIIIILLFPNGPLMLLVSIVLLCSEVWLIWFAFLLLVQRRLKKFATTIIPHAMVLAGTIIVLSHLFENSSKFTMEIADKSTLSELGLLKAEYRQVNKVTLENVQIKCDLIVGYGAHYPNITDHTRVSVDTRFYNFIACVKGRDQVSLFVPPQQSKYELVEGTCPELHDMHKAKSKDPSLTCGYRVLVEDSPLLPDTIVLHIKETKRNLIADSIVFVKDSTFTSTISRNTEELSRRRTLVEKIKDRFLIE